MARQIHRAAKRANRPNPREDRNLPEIATGFRDNPKRKNREDERVYSKKVELLPRNLSQEHYVDLLCDPSEHIVFAMGPAGCGKTLLATQFAIKSLQEGQFKKIVITRPAVSVDEQHGFLPGTLIEKMQPWMLPILDVFKEHYSVPQVQKMVENEVIEIAPLAYMRGRAQPLDSMVQTPLGPRRMGDIKLGDTVLGSNGKPIVVTGVFPQGQKKIYKITFSDGVSTLASGDHLWVTQTRSEKKHKKGFTIKTTEEIIQSKIRLSHQRNHEVPIMSDSAEFTLDLDLPIDPYLLGCLLGDGNLSPDYGSIGFTTADQELVDAVGDALPQNMSIKKTSEYDYRLVGNLTSNNGYTTNNLKTYLRESGLSGKKSFNKFIPYAYKMARTENRLAILQGILDTDGGVFFQEGRKPRIQYTSASEQLANDVAFIVRSLGGTASIRIREFKNEQRKDDRQIFHKHNSFVVEIKMPKNIIPFRLTRKAERLIEGQGRVSRFIENVEYIGDQECQCISVSGNDHLYLTDDFIVTHNTLKNSVIIGDEMQNATPSQMKMLLTRIGDNSKIVVTGDLTQHDRGYDHNGLKDIVQRLKTRGAQGISVVEFHNGDVERHPIIEDLLKIYD